MRLAVGAVALFLAGQGAAQAADIGMPSGSRNWILVRAGDCDDDGPNVNVDHGYCIGAVTVLNQPGDIGHDVRDDYEIFASALIGPEAMRGSIQTTRTYSAFLTLSMIDTYTLSSATIPAGTVVPITVSFHALGTLSPGLFCCGLYGGGGFSIKIGTAFIPDPFVVPEGSRVGGGIGPNNAANVYYPILTANGADIPLDLLATMTMNVTVGTPFDLSYQIEAVPQLSTIDFSHTATIGFTLPAETTISSTGGYGAIVPVEPSTWSGLKSRPYR